MTGEVGTNYRYLCTTCMEVLQPRDMRQHAGECAAISHLQRLDLWLLDNVAECPECGLGVEDMKAPDGMTLTEWHEYGGPAEEAPVMLHPCRCVVKTGELLNEHAD